MPDDSAAKPEAISRRLPIFALLAWALIVLAVPRLAQSLNAVDLLAFPLGFFMAAQGCLVVLVVVAVLSARRADRREGAATSASE